MVNENAVVMLRVQTVANDDCAGVRAIEGRTRGRGL